MLWILNKILFRIRIKTIVSKCLHLLLLHFWCPYQLVASISAWCHKIICLRLLNFWQNLSRQIEKVSYCFSWMWLLQLRYNQAFTVCLLPSCKGVHWKQFICTLLILQSQLGIFYFILHNSLINKKKRKDASFVFCLEKREKKNQF